MNIFFFREKGQKPTASELSTDISEKNLEEKNLSISYWVLVVTLVALFFALFNNLAVYDTLATPITENSYHFGVLQNSIM